MTATETAPQTMEFKTELKQLLDLIIHSLYTKKEIFVRELVSNAADAIDKVRFQALTDPSVAEGNTDWKIKLASDAEAGTLTISDNGIGMDRTAIVDHLGTIAKSGTKAFMENLKQTQAQDKPELIGQFGVGFYASFMAADRVTVISRMAGGEGVKWESDGQGQYTVEPAEKATRGTDVILHLREDAKEFLQGYRLREIVRQYSNFIDHPVVIDAEREKDGVKTTEEETINVRKAIWLRNKSEIKPEEYEEFYKQLARDWQPPATTVHAVVEGGATDFRALLFIPQHKPMEWMMSAPPKSGIDLYARRVLIQKECEEVVPQYLRFARGVVDSSDLPLNVSRETLQHNPTLATIKKNVVNRVLKTLEEMKSGEAEKYEKFYKEFGELLKEGIGSDYGNRERLADLLLLESTATKPGEHTSLEKYVAEMKGEQNEIVYLIGESRGLIENSPYVEAYKARGEAVLLLTDPIDEYLVSHLSEYKGKKLKAADKGDATKSDETDEQKATAEQFKPLLEDLTKKLADTAKDVKLTHRLKESAACLVADEYAPTAHMERLMRRMGQGTEAAPFKRSLELNPEHPVVKRLQSIYAADANDPKVEQYGRLLLDQAMIAEGSAISDPAGFARRVNALMTA
jgi:molecular chaperone HtpG